MKSSSRPKSSKTHSFYVPPNKGSQTQRQENFEKQPSEFNLLNLNHENVQEYLQKEKLRKTKQDNQVAQQNIQGPVIHEERRQTYRNTDQDLILSPGASSIISNADNKKESVQVFIRVRPPFTTEIENDTNTSYFYPPLDIDSELQPLWSCVQVTPPSWITLHNYQESIQRDFQYSQVFGEQSTQAEIFQLTALPLVFHVLNGYHGCYFVYGQTGTGKTYSMGVLNKINPESQGVIPSSLDFIFRFFEEQQQQTGDENSTKLLDFKVHLSFYQIYQEQIQDLFNPANKNLQVREEFGEVFVEDLVEVPVENLQQAMTIINAGLEHRQMASQNMNLTSSRSHTILNIDVYQTKQISYNKTQQISGRLTLVDLAGSERVRSTTSNGTRLEEAKHINASLSALGNVISSLANQKQQFIPYRSSKLTRVLQNSLSGSSKIVVLATMGPSVKNFQESLSTLQFAARCKDIQLTPLNHASIIQDDEEVSALKEQIMEMQTEFDKKEEDLQMTILNRERKIAQLESEIEDLRNQTKTLKEQHDKHNKQVKIKNQQLTDVSMFAVQMLIKFIETSCDSVNEAYDLNQKLLQLQQTLSLSNLVSDLDQEFPFMLEERATLDDSQIPDTEEFKKDEINLHAVVQQLTIQAQKHIEHLNFLTQTATQQILLKQFTREHLEDLELKKLNMKNAHRENLQTLIRELIAAKKLNMIHKIKQNYKIPGLFPVTERKKQELKEGLICDLRQYIADEVLPRLNFIEGGELTEAQEEEIDKDIVDVDLKFTPPHTPLKSPVEEIRIDLKSVAQKEEIQSVQQQMQKTTESNQNLPDAYLKMKLMEFDHHSGQDEEAEPERESDLSELIMKSSQLSINNNENNRRNEFTFKKQPDFSDLKPNPSQSSSEHVIIEEDKESDYSKETESLHQSPLKQLNTSQLQQLKKMPAQSQKDSGKADKVIIMSKFMAERCMLKFVNYFLDQGQQPQQPPQNCVPIIKQAHSNKVQSEKTSSFSTANTSQPKLIIKKKSIVSGNQNNVSQSVQINNSESFSKELDDNNEHSFHSLRRQIQSNNKVIHPAIIPSADIDNRFTFHHKDVIKSATIYDDDNESNKVRLFKNQNTLTQQKRGSNLKRSSYVEDCKSEDNEDDD